MWYLYLFHTIAPTAGCTIIFPPYCAAHKTKRATAQINPEDEYKTVKILVEGLKVLDEKKIKYEKYISEGGHTWMNCKVYLSIILQKLFK